jgi:hypothetical protein
MHGPWESVPARWHAERLLRIIEREAAARRGGVFDSPSSEERNATSDRSDGLDDLKLLS